MQSVMEVVSFKLVEGSSDQDFIEANDTLNSWVKQQPGFESRKLIKQQDGSWLDVVQWTSLEQAQSAGEKFMAELGDSQCMAMINPETVSMGHHDLMIQIGTSA